MGEDGSRPGVEGRLRALNLKPPPERLYGRARGHALRARQQRLLDRILPRMVVPAALASEPLANFGAPVQALWVEVGAGAGEHAATQAASNPSAGLIACETYVNGLCSLLSRLVPEDSEAAPELPPNLRIWPADARALLRLLPSASVGRLFLLFPDPWPKARHAKRRFIHPSLLPELARVLAMGAEWRVATDDPVHQVWIEDVMGAQSLFDGVTPPARLRPSDWPPTRYEAKAIAAGRQPLYWRFTRR